MKLKVLNQKQARRMDKERDRDHKLLVVLIVELSECVANSCATASNTPQAKHQQQSKNMADNGPKLHEVWSSSFGFKFICFLVGFCCL